MKVAASVLALGVAVKGVSFSAFGGLSCRGSTVASMLGTTPYKCYYVGSAASIKAQGLGNQGKDRYEVFSDDKCATQVGVVEYNDLCNNLNFLSVAYIPPTGARQKTPTQITAHDADSLESLHQELKLAVDGRLKPNQSMASWAAGVGKSGFTKRNPGDHFTFAGANVDAIDETDDNLFQTGPWEFPQDGYTQRTWAQTLITRLRDQEAAGAVTEYNGDQTVAGRSLQIDLRPNQGVMNTIPLDTITGALALFLRYRNNAGHQVWQFFQGGVQLFTLTFKAIA